MKNIPDITLNYSIADFLTSFQISDCSPIIQSHNVIWSEQLKATLNKPRKQRAPWHNLLNKVKSGHLEDLVMLKKIPRQERERNGMMNWTKKSGSIQEYSSWPVETRETFKDEFHVYCRVVGLLYSEYHVLRDLKPFNIAPEEFCCRQFLYHSGTMYLVSGGLLNLFLFRFHK
jgi:hypothetical protein